MTFSDLWCSPPQGLRTSVDEVHVWRAGLDMNTSKLHGLFQILSQEERERSARFRFQKDRDCFIAAHGLLRVILGRYLSVEPEQLRFCTNDFGKPSLCPSSEFELIRFNMSHSEKFCLYAFSGGREVGIDLEFIRPLGNINEIAKQFFSSQEVETLPSLSRDRQTNAFYNCWTRKEAYIKARGEGLSIPLDQFDVSLSPGQPATLVNSREDPQEVSRWTLMGFTPCPDFAAALAVEGHGWQLKCWQWSEE